ncbi:class I SAM-dependent methyltransferase [Clostridium sp. LBM24168]
MSEIARRLDQCRKPSGREGKTVASEMNRDHFELTSWGLDKVDIKENFMILDIGCGGGKTINRLAGLIKSGKVIGVDYSKDCVEWSKEFNSQFIKEGRVNVYNSSVERLPFKDGQFDLITAVETIYFWPDLINNLKEIKRVLKPSGKFVIINEMYMDNNSEEQYEEYVDKMNIYTPEELYKIMAKIGYKDIKMEIKEDKHWICYIGEN